MAFERFFLRAPKDTHAQQDAMNSAADSTHSPSKVVILYAQFGAIGSDSASKFSLLLEGSETSAQQK